MSADTQLDAFFAVLTVGDPTYQNTTDMMNLFCADNPSANPTIPCVGVTDYGPQFKGRADVLTLWAQLFTTFPDDIALTQILPRTYSKAAPTTIIVQTKLSGTHKADWFEPNTHPHYSPPLSGLPIAGNTMSLAACSVFTFDSSHNPLITKVAIYFDRYRMAKELGAHLP